MFPTKKLQLHPLGDENPLNVLSRERYNETRILEKSPQDNLNAELEMENTCRRVYFS